jgi:hypothetical protein
MINSITYVPELDVISTSSFDCNVYMWKFEGENGDIVKRVGSLVMGTGQQASQEQSERDKKKYAKIW